jgi:transcriptional regulator with XRE-family HTH domain
MSGRRSFNELRDKTPEGRARVVEYERTMRAVMRLAELRAERGVTQDELARGMDVSQAHVSQIERKDNLYLSTIHNYIEALGGQLRLRAVFPDQQEIDLDVLLPNEGSGVEQESGPVTIQREHGSVDRDTLDRDRDKDIVVPVMGEDVVGKRAHDVEEVRLHKQINAEQEGVSNSVRRSGQRDTSVAVERNI